MMLIMSTILWEPCAVCILFSLSMNHYSYLGEKNLPLVSVRPGSGFMPAFVGPATEKGLKETHVPNSCFIPCSESNTLLMHRGSATHYSQASK